MSTPKNRKPKGEPIDFFKSPAFCRAVAKSEEEGLQDQKLRDVMRREPYRGMMDNPDIDQSKQSHRRRTSQAWLRYRNNPKKQWEAKARLQEHEQSRSELREVEEAKAGVATARVPVAPSTPNHHVVPPTPTPGHGAGSLAPPVTPVVGIDMSEGWNTALLTATRAATAALEGNDRVAQMAKEALEGNAKTAQMAKEALEGNAKTAQIQQRLFNRMDSVQAKVDDVCDDHNAFKTDTIKKQANFDSRLLAVEQQQQQQQRPSVVHFQSPSQYKTPMAKPMAIKTTTASSEHTQLLGFQPVDLPSLPPPLPPATLQHPFNKNNVPTTSEPWLSAIRELSKNKSKYIRVVTRDEQKALRNYGKDYTINRRLRTYHSTGGDLITADQKSMANNIILGMRKLPPYLQWVARGVDSTPEQIDMLKNLAQNQGTYTAFFFLSTSAILLQQQMDSREYPKSYVARNTWMTILSKSGRFIQHFVSSSYQNEWEVLFNVGTKFRVLSYEFNETKQKHMVIMEEIQSSLYDDGNLLPIPSNE